MGAAEALRERLMQAVPSVLRERRRLGIAIDLDRLLRGVHDEAALLALEEVRFERGP